MRQTSLTFSSFKPFWTSKCRQQDNAYWILPWMPIFLVAIDETQDLKSSLIRAVATLLVVLLLGVFGRKEDEREGSRGRSVSLIEVALWLVVGTVVLLLLVEPPALWLDAATLALAVGAYFAFGKRQSKGDGGSKR